jgi:hypothetical protein
MTQENQVTASHDAWSADRRPPASAATAVAAAAARGIGPAGVGPARSGLEAMAFGDALGMPAVRSPLVGASAAEPAHVIQQRQGAIFAGQYN